MGFWVYLKNTVFSSGMFWNGDSLYITVTGVTERSVHSKTIFSQNQSLILKYFLVHNHSIVFIGCSV